MYESVFEKVDYCTGCGLCKNICPKKCISMEIIDGFYYPKINKEKCIDCGACRKMCPHYETVHNENIKAFAAYDLDDENRKNSSSGGVFGLIAQEFILNGGIIYGAIYDDTFKVKHKKIDSIEKLPLLKTSKYSQSNCHDIYSSVKKDLSNNKKVLFSGTPCQVAAIKKYCKGFSNLYTIDFICHSVPSPILFDKYICSLEKKYKSKIINFNFRNKCSGWENKKFSVTARFKNNQVYEALALKDPFFRSFVFGVICRCSCESCHFKSDQKASDITIADFWGIWDYLPEISSDLGVSLIMQNNNRGAEMLKMISNKSFINEVDYEEMHKFNPAIDDCFIPIHNQKRKIKKLLECNIENYIDELNKSTNFSIIDRLMIKYESLKNKKGCR